MPTYEELIETLVKKNTLPFSKVGIISSLVRLRDTRAIPHFIEVLNDENHYVRREAARAIGQLSSSESTAALLRVLENESDEETRRNVLIALGNIGDERAVETLRQALKDPSYWIRRAAEMGLKQLQKRLEMQQPVVNHSLDTSISEESAFAEGPTSVEEIPSYRELTNSISQEIIVKPSKINETTSPTPETITEETVSNEYRANIPPTSLRMSDEQTVSPLPLFPPTPSLPSPIPPVYEGEQGRREGEEGGAVMKGGRDTWRCNRCGDEVDSYYDVCQTCGGRRGEPGREEILSEDADLEEWFEKEVDLNCPRCGEKMLDGYLFTESDDALIFNYQEENDVVIGRGTQMGFICLNCNLISFPFRGKRQYVREGNG